MEVADRRTLHDRRRRTLHALAVGAVRGRRRRVRRHESSRIAAIDWHPARYFAAVFLTLILSCIDSLNTLVLLTRGFMEMNPLMRSLITGGELEFALVKLGLTAASLTALVILTPAKAFGRFPAKSILYASAAFYVVLVGYEFWMLSSFTSFE